MPCSARWRSRRWRWRRSSCSGGSGRTPSGHIVASATRSRRGIYVLCFAGLLANYFIDPAKRLEGYCGAGFALLGAAVYGLFLRGRGEPGASSPEGIESKPKFRGLTPPGSPYIRHSCIAPGCSRGQLTARGCPAIHVAYVTFRPNHSRSSIEQMNLINPGNWGFRHSARLSSLGHLKGATDLSDERTSQDSARSNRGDGRIPRLATSRRCHHGQSCAPDRPRARRPRNRKPLFVISRVMAAAR